MDRLEKILYEHNEEHRHFLIRFEKSKMMDDVQNNNHIYRNI